MSGRSVARWSLAAVAVTFLALGADPTAGAEPPPPAFEVGADRVLIATLPAGVLASGEVRPRLTSGLTTSLALAVTAVDDAGHKVRGGGVVEVRYELWDEVFLVSATGSDGRRQQASLPSLDRLIAWWQGLRLRVLTAGNSLAAGSWRVEAHLTVVPFSRSEQSATQEWLSRSVGATPAGADEPASAGPTGGVLDMLVATSIKRRSVVSFDWHGVVVAGAAAAVGAGSAGAAPPGRRPEPAAGAPPP